MLGRETMRWCEAAFASLFLRHFWHWLAALLLIGVLSAWPVWLLCRFEGRRLRRAAEREGQARPPAPPQG